MGTPDFAVAPLRAMLEAGYEVVAVVTMPDKPVGRHQSQPQPSAVKRFAVERGLPVLQPERLKDEAFVEELRSYQADLQVVVAFRMLPEVVWRMPRLGTFNLHASLLPKYRGAAPINWAIMNGERETGVTTFFLQHAIDTGNIILQRSTPILQSDNAETLHDRLMAMGSEAVVETLRQIETDTVHEVPQPTPAEGAALPAAPKIFKETCRVDWHRPSVRVNDFIRGLCPYPAAWTEASVCGKPLTAKLYRCHPQAASAEEELPAAGTVVISPDRESLRVATADGYIIVDELQPAGKRRMKAADYLRGLHGA